LVQSAISAIALRYAKNSKPESASTGTLSKKPRDLENWR